MIFELVDRSGASGGARSSPQQPSSDVPSSVSDFNEQVNSAGGAGALAEKGNNAKDAGASSPIEVPPATTETLPAVPVSQPQPPSDEKLTPEIPATSQDGGENQIGELVNLLRQGARDSGLGALIPSSLAPIVSAGESLIDRVISSIPSATSQPTVPPVFIPSAPTADSLAPSTAAQQLADGVTQAAELPPSPPPLVTDQGGQSINAAEIASSAASAASDVAQAAGTAVATAGAAGASTAGTTALAGFAATAASLAGPLALAASAIAVPVAAATSLSAIAEQIRGDIGGLSPEVAQANAEANVRQTLANARTAERLGDEIASITESRSRLETSLQGIRDVLAEPVLSRLAGAQQGVSVIAELTNRSTQENAFAISAIQSVVDKSVASTLNTLFPGASLLTDALAGIATIAERFGFEFSDDGGSNPIDVYSREPFLKLPPPFTGTEDLGLNADFVDVPGLDLP